PREPQGIAVVPESARIVVATGEGRVVQIRDRVDFHLVKTIPLGDDPDNVRYDPAAKRVYVGYGSGGIAAIDPEGRKVGEVQLAGHPESFQLESSGSRMFVNVPTARQIVVIDRLAMKVVATWPVMTARSN